MTTHTQHVHYEMTISKNLITICSHVSFYINTMTKASGPITSWEIDGETVSDFILGGSKITAHGAAMKLKDTDSLERKL